MSSWGLIATIAACLIMPGRPPYAHAVAGFAAALAIAIGAETTPHIAVIAPDRCASMALAWRTHAGRSAQPFR
jgi:hypothetical protein